MKKIVDGKVYNTETANEVGHYRNEYGRSDFKFCEETLYRTLRGNYFLEGEGGAMSKYSRSCGDNTWCGGSGIIPLTKDEAFKWAERCLRVEIVEKEFVEILVEA
jgi:hypothetical protein